MSKLTRQFREKRAVAEIGMRALNLIAQHAFERVLEDGDDVSETFVKRVNVRIARLAKQRPQAVYECVRDFVRDDVVRQAREHGLRKVWALLPAFTRKNPKSTAPRL